MQWSVTYVLAWFGQRTTIEPRYVRTQMGLCYGIILVGVVVPVVV